MNEQRLIDANALKEAISDVELSLTNKRTILGIVDNAQTIETYTEEDLKKAIKTGYDDGYAMAKAKYERPQGKWISKGRDSRGYCDCFECSNCGAYIYPHCLEKELDYNGCPYCFADMRGEKK